MGSRGSKPSICAFWQMRVERFRAPLRSIMKARFCGFWTSLLAKLAIFMALAIADVDLAAASVDIADA